MQRATHQRYAVLLCILVLVQILFWSKTTRILPDMTIVPSVPGRETVSALSFGDEQFFFRSLALTIQNCGDTFGRFTALYKYDYKKLYHWFTLLDDLDNKSAFVPTIATFYFSQTQNIPDVRYIVDYLYEHSADRPQTQWWWLVQAVYLANHKLNDKTLALRVAKPLIHAEDVPLIARQMPAFIYEQLGEYDEALAIMDGIKRDIKNIPPGELNFMRYFVEERLKNMEKKQKTRGH